MSSSNSLPMQLPVCQAHRAIDQRRKYTNEPYIVHPDEVAAIVAALAALECAA